MIDDHKKRKLDEIVMAANDALERIFTQQTENKFAKRARNDPVNWADLEVVAATWGYDITNSKERIIIEIEEASETAVYLRLAVEDMIKSLVPDGVELTVYTEW